MKGALVLLIPFLVLLALSACNGSPTEPQFPHGTLAGTVVFGESGQPAGGARVIATMIAGTSTGEGLTDALGRYSLSIPGGSYNVRVNAPGATTAALIVLIDIVPGPNAANFRISANGCAIVTGRVLDGVTRAPISGAAITFFGQRTVTAADGSYQMNLGCPPRPATVSETIVVDHPAYQRREYLVGVPTYSTTWDIYMQPR